VTWLLIGGVLRGWCHAFAGETPGERWSSARPITAEVDRSWAERQLCDRPPLRSRAGSTASRPQAGLRAARADIGAKRRRTVLFPVPKRRVRAAMWRFCGQQQWAKQFFYCRWSWRRTKTPL